MADTRGNSICERCGGSGQYRGKQCGKCLGHGYYTYIVEPQSPRVREAIERIEEVEQDE